MSIIDLTGQKFGRWTVIEMCVNYKRGKTMWVCRCDCGVERAVKGDSLRSGVSSSCGCYNREVVRALAKHGMSGTPEYTAWLHMRDRCRNPDHEQYPDYGGRGVLVCDRWYDSFEHFYSDMGPKPSKKHSLDRLDNEYGNYEPSNCEWRTAREQLRNTRRNRWIEHNGERMVLIDWAKKLN